MDQLHRPVAEVHDLRGAERVRRREHPGRGDVGVLGTARVGRGRLLQGRCRSGQVVGHRVVGEHGRSVVLLAHHHVAEGVVEVLVRVHDGDHVADAEPADLRHRAPCCRLGGQGVDHQQATVAADQADVDVEEGEPGDPAAVGDLDEAGVVGDVTHAAHATVRDSIRCGQAG